MPTARELLEQADALMRRNRLRAVEARPAVVDVPVLTEAIAAIAVSVPSETIDEPLARAFAPDTALATAEDDATSAVVPSAPVDESAAAVETPPPAAAAIELPDVDTRTPVLALDDVPVLTDIVEEIEAPMVVGEIDAPVEAGALQSADEADVAEALGEPSRWLDADRGEASITGPWPDSIAVVPAPGSHAESREAPMDGERHGEEEGGSAGASIDVEALAEETLALQAHVADAVDGDVRDDAMPVEASRPRDAEEGVDAPEQLGFASAQDGGVVAEDEFALDELEAPAAPPAQWPDDSEDAIAAGAQPLEPSASPFASGVESHAGSMPEPPSASAALASARALVANHEAPPAAAVPIDADDHWDALAEEIRMQVLQRIDIFTDTGLREQLTARLQPIVDRASADLVATINQHVGQLLRTYVAEAIEREIEKWRQGGG